jgi:hypothetical protein
MIFRARPKRLTSRCSRRAYSWKRRYPISRRSPSSALRPAAVWPFVADSARINEIAGMPAYKIEERADAQVRIHRLASIRYGPIRVKWEEDFGEWQENRWLSRTRHFIHGPFGRFVAAAEVHPEGRMVFSAKFECLGVLGWLRLSGQIGREGDKRLGAIERMIRDQTTGATARESAKPAAPVPPGADCRSCVRSGEPRPRAQARRVSAACAVGGVAQHSPAVDGAILARDAGGDGRAVPRGAAPRHHGHGLGFTLPALPRCQSAG